MGSLALAGAISGMGEGLGRGLFAMEQGFIQQGLMQEREKLEQARLEKTFAHTERMADIAENRAAGREQRQMTHAENLQQQQIEANRAMNQERIGAGLVEKGMDVQFRKDLNESDLAQKDRVLQQKAEHDASELAQRKEEKQAETALGKEKLENERQHYNDWRTVFSQRYGVGTSKPSASVKTNDRRDAIQYLDQLRKHIIDMEKSKSSAIENMDQAGADRLSAMLDDAYEQYDALKDHINSSMGIQSKGASSGIVDPRLMRNAPAPSSKTAPVLPSSSITAPVQQFGNAQPTAADMLEFQRQYDEASQGRGRISDVVESFKQRFGRTPSQSDYDLLKRGSR